MKGLLCLTLLIFLPYAFPALGQNNSSCSDVLLLTGREETLLVSSDLGREYEAWGKQEGRHKSAAGGGAYDAISGKFAYSSTRNKSEYSETEREWRRELFRHADQVFAPAVAAWSSCMAASASGINVTAKLTNDARALIITFLRQAGSTGEIEGFLAPNDVKCIDETSNVNLSTTSQIQLQYGETWSARCVRDLSGSEEREIVVRLNQASAPILKFIFPELAGQSRAFDPATAAQLLQNSSPANCASPAGGVIAPKPYDRSLKIEGLAVHDMFDNASTATMNVLVNGRSISSDGFVGRSRSRTLRTEVMYQLPAFVAGLVEVETSNRLAGCQLASIRVLGP